MIKFAPNISIYDLNDFQDIVHEVVWVFSKNLKNVSRINQRFNIHIVQSTNEERMILDGSIKSIWKCLNENDNKTNSTIERKTQLLNFITSCFLDVSKPLNWSQESILHAQKNSLSEQIVFNYMSKPKLNSTRTYSAILNLELKNNKVSISVIFKDIKLHVEERVHLIDTNLFQIDWFGNFNKYRWFDNSSFGFEFQNDLTLMASVDTKKSHWSPPKTKMDEYFINLLTTKIEEEKIDFAKWANW